ncbi:hypothetical protein HUJ05_000730 [Dendroctonus ponderosae]|nr:hypothetical protein HUJ05_000730 [Dendroctonus ponderosae]
MMVLPFHTLIDFILSPGELIGEVTPELILKLTAIVLLQDDNFDVQFQFDYRGPVQMKGKSDAMHVYLLSRNLQKPQSTDF